MRNNRSTMTKQETKKETQDYGFIIHCIHDRMQNNQGNRKKRLKNGFCGLSHINEESPVTYSAVNAKPIGGGSFGKH